MARPISEAPKDGTLILAWSEDVAAQNPAIIYWEPGSVVFDIMPHWRSSTHEALLDGMFTHWMPLPPMEDAE